MIMSHILVYGVFVWGDANNDGILDDVSENRCSRCPTVLPSMFVLLFFWGDVVTHMSPQNEPHIAACR